MLGRIRQRWDDSDPTGWKRAASDWRAITCLEESARRGNDQLAAELGYASSSKIRTLNSDARQLLAAAEDGDQEAVDRVGRARDLGRMLAERARGSA